MGKIDDDGTSGCDEFDARHGAPADPVFEDFDAAMNRASDAGVLDGMQQCFALSTAYMALGLRAVMHAQANGQPEDDGARNTADWLQRHLGIPLGTAHKYVKVAEALEDLPCLAAALFRGEFGFDQVFQIARFATPETEADLIEECRGMSVTALQQMARRAEARTAEQEDRACRRRYLHMHWDGTDEVLRLRAWLPGKLGHEVATTLAAIAEQHVPETPGEWPLWSTQLADALVMCCRQTFADQSQAAKPHLVVHVDAEQLQSAVETGDDMPGVGHFELGPAISPDMTRRLRATRQFSSPYTTRTAARSRCRASAARFRHTFSVF